MGTKQDGKNHEYTALHAWALRSYAWSNCEESIETASILLVAGCDVNSKHGDGRTPLFGLACFSDTETTMASISLLAGHGADAKTMDVKGSTPLHTITGYSMQSSALSSLLAAT